MFNNKNDYTMFVEDKPGSQSHGTRYKYSSTAFFNQPDKTPTFKNATKSKINNNSFN